jgi:hypothetical protein
MAAGSFGVELQPLDVLGAKDIESAFRAATKAYANAVIVLPSAILSDHRTQVASLALKRRLSAIYRQQTGSISEGS